MGARLSSATISTTALIAQRAVGQLAAAPIDSRSLVRRGNGTSAKGVPKLSTIWLMTSAHV